MIRKAALVTIAVAALTLAIGYGLAKAAIPRCTQVTLQELKSKNVHGIGIDGKRVPTEELTVTVEVRWPFVVSVSYFVPFDLHRSRHENLHVVLPWQTIKKPQEPVYYL